MTFEITLTCQSLYEILVIIYIIVFTDKDAVDMGKNTVCFAPVHIYKGKPYILKCLVLSYKCIHYYTWGQVTEIGGLVTGG